MKNNELSALLDEVIERYSVDTERVYYRFKYGSALKEIGGNVKYTVYPEAKHDSWTKTYMNPELHEWFLSQRKNV